MCDEMPLRAKADIVHGSVAKASAAESFKLQDKSRSRPGFAL